MHALLDEAELEGGERNDDHHQDDRLRGGRAEVQVHEAIIIDLVDQRFRRLGGAAAGNGMDDAEGIEEGVNRVDDQKEEGCRRQQRKTMVQKRREPRAPSMEAASSNDFGIACKPATRTGNYS